MMARVKKTYTVYSITNTVTGKRYIGYTCNPKKRRNTHFSALRGGYHPNAKLLSSFAKHGENAFVWEVLETGIKERDRETHERRWIAMFDSYRNGYNLTLGGEGVTVLPKKCVWEGVVYRSAFDAAKQLGISESCVRFRAQKGWVCEADIPKALGSKHKPCEWNGAYFESVLEAAEAAGIPPSTMSRYIARGYTCDDDTPNVTNAKQKCTWNGIEYASYTQAAKALGIDIKSLIRRIEKGYTCDADMIHPNSKLTKSA